LKVHFEVKQDMVAAVTSYPGGSSPNGGFTIQLNAYNPVGPVTQAMQYIFGISGSQIWYQVQYWGPIMGNWANRLPGGGPSGTIISSLPSNTIPAGYVFEIDLDTPDASSRNVTGGTFHVTDTNGKTTSASFTLPSGYLYPIRAFQVNIVGPDDSRCSEFSSGGGKIDYKVSSGQLCVASGATGVCGANNGITTCEISNITYGEIGPLCCNEELWQQYVSFSPAITCPPSKFC
jgi:hypothetical protein